ncbi:hypothetical protein DL240_08375 [Lujinxingia litoralis]|uniref:RND transporter n=1 Tax=Lujinxingia litoralis TaxID=2211119 RepID=A0A328C5X3_9DELT|nr:hypothetical protein [Lujinxingia litoralis]RAL22899.1 hypothetical protein DL240_08375 [Lujinxingia litoralis]
MKAVIYRWLDALSYKWILPLALLLALAPGLPEPHLVETSRMLVGGELTRAAYIFDFVMHSAGLSILALKVFADLFRWLRSTTPAPAQAAS